MAWFWLTTLVVLLGWVCPATAQVTVGLTKAYGPPGVLSAQGGSGVDLRKFDICLVPDTQNVIAGLGSQFDQTVPPATEFHCGVNTDEGCSGIYCTKSPYCEVSWQQTASILARGLAFSLTGQWDRIDWTRIKGLDNIVAKPTGAQDHDTCDLILSLGDMEGIPDGVGPIETDTYADLAVDGYSYQVDTVNNFWWIIKQSGIPYLMNQGNHDNWSTFKARYTELGVENEPWFYEAETTYDLSYAILVPVWSDQSICVISVSWEDTNYSTARENETVTWLTSVVGCGANWPTIIVSHGEVFTDGTLSPGPEVGATKVVDTIIGEGAAPGTAGMSEIFMVAGGHYLVAISSKTVADGLFGADTNAAVYRYFSNWQNEQRHSSGNVPFGPTPTDSNGAFYTIVTLDADRDRICAHDWSPYWQVANGGTANGQQANITTSAGCLAFDFDTRFP